MSVGALIASFRERVAPGNTPLMAPEPARRPTTHQTIVIHPVDIPEPTAAKTAAGIGLVALDMDGTLLNFREAITARVHRALRAAIGRGVHIVLATARPPRAVRFYHQSLGLKTPIISQNGALVWDEKNRRPIHHLSINADLAKKVITFARKMFPDLLACVEIIDKQYAEESMKLPPETSSSRRMFSPEFICPIDAFLRVPATRLLLQASVADLDHLEQAIQTKFPGKFNCFRSNPKLLQLTAEIANKGYALEIVARQFNIPQNRVMAIGDSHNDLHMLQWAGLGVAVANAHENIKSQADHTVPSNDSDGVAVALEQFVLNPTKRPKPIT